MIRSPNGRNDKSSQIGPGCFCRKTLFLGLLFSLTPLCDGQPATPSPWKGAISGRLFDEEGRPLPGWNVAAARWTYNRGRKELDVRAGSAQTKSDGSFIVENLAPGEYCLRAEWPYHLPFGPALSAARLPVPPSPKRPGEAYVTTYFPGVMDPASAEIIRVRPGAPQSPVRFRLRGTRVFRVRGKGSRGLLSIELLDSPVPTDRQPVFARPEGTFEVDRLPPGAYVLSTDRSRTIVVVTDHDLTDVTLDAQPCPKLSGTITLDGAPTAPKTDMGELILFTRLDRAVSIPGHVNSKGAFKVDCVEPGIYSVDPSVQSGQYLKSIVVDGKDVTNSPLDLTTPGDKTVDIAISSHAADLFGSVRDGTGKTRAGTPVTIWSDDFNVTVTSAPDGTFEISNLPPGNYRVAAWDQLYVQPSGWGVTTMRDFRDHFEIAAGTLELSTGQRSSIDPPLIQRASIVEAASELHLHARMNEATEMDAIAKAIESPAALARFLKANSTIDWSLLRRALGLAEAKYWRPPCADNCSTQIVPVPNADQAILVIRGDEISPTVEYLRYVKNSNGAWRFAGEKNSYQRNSPSSYRLMKWGEKPFVAISSDLSQNGFATQQVLEEWFDLAQQDFLPVFAFTPEGSQWRFGFGVGRTIKGAYAFSRTPTAEKIELTLKIHFNGVGLDHPATYVGVYSRAAGEKSFTLRSATIPVEDFAGIADPFSSLSNEALLKYALPGLQKIAQGSDHAAKEWLKSILSSAKDTREKRALLALMKQ
jgi:Carboxypeptidase regulatory-like domain